eukprot:TRINITY_DN113225_c0_g1_i1.p1 TRINITY_DN113225_c0_g1~~TRINITY_DN113225_c0_g1_i1.p1  ORF type:complete len:566 (-),score=157.00 TRINITY_DN113225_c0_g1_i1:109-1806(-)
MSETDAVSFLEKELEKAGGSAAIGSFSIRIKWGQGDLAGHGAFRKFLEKFPAVFQCQDKTVSLAPAAAVAAPPQAAASAMPAYQPPAAVSGEKRPAGPPTEAPPTSKAKTLAASLPPTAPPVPPAPAPPGVAPAPPAPPAGGKGKSGGKGRAKGEKGGSSKSGAEPSWREDTLSDEMLTNVLSESKVKGVELEIEALARRIAPSSGFRTAAERCLNVLRKQVDQHWKPGNATLDFQGSFVQGSDIEGGDVDMSLKLSQTLSPEDRANSLLAFSDRLANNLAAYCSIVPPQQLFPAGAALFAVQLKPLQGVPPMLINVIASETLPAEDSEAPLALDTVISQLCDCCEASRDFLRLVKLWASNNGFMNLLDGFMNGTAWAMLGLFFLQKMSILPPYGKIANREKAPMIAAPPMPQLLYDFFLWLSGAVSNPNRGYSLVHAAEYPVPAPAAGGAHAAIFLEDPAEFHSKRQQRNCAETLVEHQLTRICSMASEMASHLQPTPVRWYNWAEVFDRTQVSASKKYTLRDCRATVQNAQPGRGGVPSDFGSFAWMDNTGKSSWSGKGSYGY